VKRKIFFLIAVVLLLVILIGLAPVFLSSQWLRDTVIKRINDSGSGKVAIESCTFGWQQGFVCKQVEYDDAGKGYHLSIPQVSSSQGLLALVVAPHNLGTITLDTPYFVFSPPVTTAGSDTVSSQTETPAPGTLAEKKDVVTDGVPLWDKFFLHVLVNEAEMDVVSGKDGKMHLFHHAFLDAALSDGSVNFTMNLEAVENDGTARAEGFLNLPVRQSSLLETMVAEVKVHVDDIELKPFATLLPESAQVPEMAGRLSAQFLAKTAGLSSIQAKGTGILSDVAMSGGILDTDEPHFDKIDLRFDVKKGPEYGLQIPEFHAVSDVGILDLTGNYTGGKSSVKGKGKLDLPVIFSQFPHLTKMRPDTKVDRGSMEISVSLEQVGPQVDIMADAKISEFSGRQARKNFSWASPVTLDFIGVLGGSSVLQVKKADLDASFMHLEGKGELKDFTVHGTADLNKAAREVGSIFDLAWGASGKMLLNASSREIGTDHYFVKTHLDIADFTLSHRHDVVLPRHKFTLTAQLDTPKKFPKSIAESMTLNVDLSTWPGKVTGKLDSIFRTEKKISSNYNFQSTLDMGRLSDILHSLKVVDKKTTLAGKMNLTTSGYSEGNKVVIRKLDSIIHNLVVHQHGAVFRDSQIRVFSPALSPSKGAIKGLRPLKVSEDTQEYFENGAGFTFLDSGKHELVIRDTELATGKGNVKVDRFALTDWQKAPRSLSVKAAGHTDFGALTPVLQEFDVLSPEQTLTGKANFTVNIVDQKNGQQKGSLQVDVRKPALSSRGKIVFSDEAIGVSSTFSGKLSTGDIDFDQLRMSSTPLKVQAQGRLQRTGKNPHISVTGTYTPDYDSLTAGVHLLQEKRVSAKGAKSQKFDFSLPLGIKGQKSMEKIRLATTLQASKLSGSGIVFKDFFMPVTMKGGVFQGKLTGKLYESAINVSPRVDFTAVPPLISLPPDTQLFNDVLLEKPLVDGVFKRIHPLLGELAQPKGRVSGRITRFSWPLEKKGADQADFSLVLDTRKITLAAAGILRHIFAIIGLDDDILVLKQSEIVCSGNKGRIQCTPLQILAGDTEMRLAGSVGFDSSLDFVLEIPVTKKLVGTEGFRLLEGTTIKVPIQGDSDNAVFDADILSGTMEDLLAQAAKNAVKKEVKKQVERLLPGLLDKIIGN